MSTSTTLIEVWAERKRQDDRWGEQNHPNIPADGGSWAIGLHQSAAQMWKTNNDQASAKGELTWDAILLEEVHEALAETRDDAKLREELLQVAAVAVAWIEAIDRRHTSKYQYFSDYPDMLWRYADSSDEGEVASLWGSSWVRAATKRDRWDPKFEVNAKDLPEWAQ